MNSCEPGIPHRDRPAVVAAAAAVNGRWPGGSRRQVRPPVAGCACYTGYGDGRSAAVAHLDGPPPGEPLSGGPLGGAVPPAVDRQIRLRSLRGGRAAAPGLRAQFLHPPVPPEAPLGGG